MNYVGNSRELVDAVRREISKPLTFRQRLRLIKRALSPRSERSGRALGEAFEEGLNQSLSAVDWGNVGAKIAVAVQKSFELKQSQPPKDKS